MLDLSPYFSSEAKFKVLCVLDRHAYPIPLRHIAYLSQIPVFSVERALKTFLKDKLVSRRSFRANPVYELRRTHPTVPLISKVFRVIQEENQKQEALHISKRAPEILAFASDMQAMIRNAKLNAEE